MSPPRARVVRAAQTGTLSPLLPPRVSTATHKRIAKEEVEAHFAAERIEREARANADEIVEQARRDALDAGRQAREAATAEAHAQAVAQWAAVRRAEDARLAASADRVVALAVVLAERLVGAALDVHPERVASIARSVIAEARGARRATLDAHPTDAEALRQQLHALGLPAGAVEVRDDASLARGALRLHTDVGVLDAQLTPRLERLAAVLADALA